ncbi:unnamed protein product, partial [Closterium sp. Naga37s-1]
MTAVKPTVRAASCCRQLWRWREKRRAVAWLTRLMRRRPQPLRHIWRRCRTYGDDLEEEVEGFEEPADEAHYRHLYDAHGVVDKWLGDPALWGMLSAPQCGVSSACGSARSRRGCRHGAMGSTCRLPSAPPC